MINLLYLLKVLNTKKLSELVGNIDAAPIDINLAVWAAIDAGDISVNEKRDRVIALKEAEPWHDPELAEKMLKVMRHYAKNEANITRGRLFASMKDPSTAQGYPTHEYLMTFQYLVDTKQIEEIVFTVPKTPKRPFHRFVFLCLPGNPNEEWNSKAINKWISNFEKNSVK